MKTIYVDTSVFGGCYDEGFAPSSMELLNEFKRGKNRMMYSDLVEEELFNASKKIQTLPSQIPDRYMIRTKVNHRAWLLANKYLQEGILGYESFMDAGHIALATLQGADILASWNFKHLVNEGKIKKYNAINKNMGYRLLEIQTPLKILNP